MMIGALALALAATPISIASPEWNVVDIKPDLAAFYSEQLAQALRGRGLKVTTARDITTLLGAERQRALLGCNENSDSCMAELANALGCDATLTVSLARLGSGFRGLAKLMHSGDGAVLSSVQIDAASELELADRLVVAARALAEPFKPTQPAAVSMPVRPWWVPGVAGLVVLGGALTAFAVAGNTHQRLLIEPSEQRARDLVAQGETAQVLAWVGTGVAGAALIASVLWLTFGLPTVKPVVGLAPDGVHLGLRGTF